MKNDRILLIAPPWKEVLSESVNGFESRFKLEDDDAVLGICQGLYSRSVCFYA